MHTCTMSCSCTHLPRYRYVGYDNQLVVPRHVSLLSRSLALGQLSWLYSYFPILSMRKCALVCEGDTANVFLCPPVPF